jgi:cytochrome bd-type quinol oxidase subunit 2
LVDIVVVPMGLQSPSAPPVLPPLGTPCSIQCLVARICFCIYQALAEHLRRQLYQVLVGMHFLALAIVSVFGVCIWDGWIPKRSSLWMAFSSVSAAHFVRVLAPVITLLLLLRRTKAPTLWCFFLVSFMWSVNCILGIPSFCANVHVSVST